MQTRNRLSKKITEAQWQSTVIGIAKSYGWRVHHGRAVKLANGRHMTPIQGHKGFPDLVLAKDGRVILAELKQDGRYPEPEQRAWRDAIGQQWRLWRPKDRDAVVAELSKPPRRPTAAPHAGVQVSARESHQRNSSTALRRFGGDAA